MQITLNAYWRLMRFDKPVGILLLWFPTAWALWISKDGHPQWCIAALFALGTIVMRAAGCVVNDVADRKFDGYVKRTKTRPLAVNELSVYGALSAFLALLSIALLILIQLPLSCYPWAFAALAITVIYPFCKRFLSAPQCVLGLAFSMGIPMAFIAQNASLNNSFMILMMINFLWIVAYDTMYAMTDREDDLKIGVKSTAIWFGRYDIFIIAMMLCIMHGLWLRLGSSTTFYVTWTLATVILINQLVLIKDRDPQQCFLAFRRSVYYGAMMWLAVLF